MWNGCWPGPNNTGIPAGTQLTTYSGPCTITANNTVIDAKTINCDLTIRAVNVTVKNSKLNGIINVESDSADAGAKTWSVTVQASEIDGGTVQLPAVSQGNITVLQSNVHGAATGVQCDESSSWCVVRDTWIHGQNIPAGANWHLGGFLSNGGSAGIELTHNTVACDAQPTSNDGGCTGDINLIANFAPIGNVLIQKNLLKANSTGSAFCTYGASAAQYASSASNIDYFNNVFERGSNNQCAAYGPVTDYNVQSTASGTDNSKSQWFNNLWDDGGAVPPSM